MKSSANKEYLEIALEGTYDLELLLQPEIDTIYVGRNYCPRHLFNKEDDAWLKNNSDKIRKKGKKIYLLLPALINEAHKDYCYQRIARLEKFIDGICTADLGAAAKFIHKLEVCLITQISNKESLDLLTRLGIKRIRHLLPFINMFRDENHHIKRELLAYGRFILNYSPYCVFTILNKDHSCNHECLNPSDQIVHKYTGEQFSVYGGSLVSHRPLDIINEIFLSDNPPECMLINAQSMKLEQLKFVLEKIKWPGKPTDKYSFNGCILNTHTADLLNGFPWRKQLKILKLKNQKQ